MYGTRENRANLSHSELNVPKTILFPLPFKVLLSSFPVPMQRSGTDETEKSYLGPFGHYSLQRQKGVNVRPAPSSFEEFFVLFPRKSLDCFSFPGNESSFFATFYSGIWEIGGLASPAFFVEPSSL